MIWRFTGWRRLHSEAAEQRAQKLVAIQFFLLAPYVTVEAVHKLIAGEEPSTEVGSEWPLTASSRVIGMPLLGIAKRRLADPARLGRHEGRGQPEPALRLSRRRPC